VLFVRDRRRWLFVTSAVLHRAARLSAVIDLDQEVLDRVDKIMVDAVPAYGPSPETV